MGLVCTDGPSLTTLGFKRKRLKLSLRSYRPRFAVGTSVSYSRMLGGLFPPSKGVARGVGVPSGLKELVIGMEFSSATV